MPSRSTGLGKRSKQKKDKRKSGGKHADSNGSAPQIPQKGEPAVPADLPAGLEERGAFAFGSCERCGWRGPARRSRERARKDLDKHIQDKPKHADHAEVSETTT